MNLGLLYFAYSQELINQLVVQYNALIILRPYKCVHYIMTLTLIVKCCCSLGLKDVVANMLGKKDGDGK